MAAPQYALTNLFTNGTSDPAADVITLIENQLNNTEWVFVEQALYTSTPATGSIPRLMRIWKCPATLNAAGVDFYVGLIKNQATGSFIQARVFEGWNTTTKLIQRPCLQGSANLAVTWSAIAYGNSQFTAVAGNTASAWAATSPDGATWTPRILPSSAIWNMVAYGNNTWVTLAGAYNVASSAAASSSDAGATWVARTTAGSGTWTGLAYGAGLFVAIQYGNTAYQTSPDGITWTSRTTLPVGAGWVALTYGNGTFVAVAGGYGGTSTAAATSTDGINWTLRTLPNSNWIAVTYGAAGFLAVGLGQTAATSPTGATWTQQTMPTSGATGVAYGNGFYLVTTGTSGQTFTTPDGVTWTTRSAPGSMTGTLPIAFGGGIFSILCPTSAQFAAATTSDDITFTSRSLGTAITAAVTDYQLTGATLPPMTEPSATLSVAANLDVAVLVSKSYLAININTNGLTSNQVSWILGLYQPAYPDSPAANPPLMCLNPRDSLDGGNSGVSRSMRVPTGSHTFAANIGPESLTLGMWTNFGGVRDTSTNSLRGSRAAVVAGVGTYGFSSSYLPNSGSVGAVRGYLYDAIIVNALSSANVAKLNDTLTIGATTYVPGGGAVTNITASSNGGTFAIFLNPAGGS